MFGPELKGTASEVRRFRAIWKRVISEYPLCKSPDGGTQLAAAIKVTWSVIPPCARVQRDGRECNSGQIDPINASLEAFEVE